MSHSNDTHIIAAFASRADAEAAINDLRHADFRDDQIGLLARSDLNRAQVDVDGSESVGEGIAAGAVTGGALGAAAGLAVLAGLIPGIGPAIAGGMLASVVSSATLGAAAGGVIGGLIGMGLSEDDARYYEGEVKMGRTIVTVRPEGHALEARDILFRHHAYGRPLSAVGSHA